MYSFKKPAVFVCLWGILQTVLILSFADLFPIILLVSIALSTAVFISFYKNKDKTVAIVLGLLMLIPALTSSYSYNTGENKAKAYAYVFNQNQDAKYTARITKSNTYTNYNVIYADLISFNGENLDDTPNVRISFYSDEALAPGDTIVFSGNAEHVSNIVNDDFDTVTYLRGNGVFLDFQNVKLISASPYYNADIFLSLRNLCTDLLYKYLDGGKNLDSTAICCAMFAGDVDLIPVQTKDAFSASGTIHILCVSGLHLTLIAGIFSAILSYFTIHKKLRCILIIVFCLFYTAFTGFNLSTLRAAIMCTITLSSHFLGRKSDAVISLFVSAYLILLFSPYSIFNLSLILSFFATLGIIVTPYAKNNKSGRLNKLLNIAKNAVLANIGAVAFTIPITAFFFKTVSIYSVAATLCISFISELVLAGIFILILLYPLSVFPIYDNFLHLYGNVLETLASLIIKIVEFFSRLPYAVTHIDLGLFFLICFLVLTFILSFFMAIGRKKPKFLCTCIIILTSLSFLVCGLYAEILDDTEYKVQYFRQNQDDRQLSIKLGVHGYLLVNADSSLCTQSDKCAFDEYGKNNYLLLIPDDTIIPSILCDKIKLFDKQYGIKKVFVPQTNEGRILGEALTLEGINCEYMPEKAVFDEITLTFNSNQNYHKITVDDEKEKTAIVFSDGYNADFFDDTSDICAFFTRKTKNQFQLGEDTPPKCDTFFTRLKKAESQGGFVNTFGKKSFYIKE